MSSTVHGDEPKILEMIYDDYEGAVQVDGVDYKDISQIDFNDQVAVIDQDIFLFEDTIENNISLYKPLSDEVMQKAIKGAGLENFIDEQEKGKRTQILENGKNFYLAVKDNALPLQERLLKRPKFYL